MLYQMGRDILLFGTSSLMHDPAGWAADLLISASGQ
jgi:hypothetical protein